MTNRHNIYISFSYENENIDLLNKVKNTLIGKGLKVEYSKKEDRSEDKKDTIWNQLLTTIKNNATTIVLLTEDLFTKNKYKIYYKNNDFNSSGWIYKEISASLRNHEDNNINGVICIVDSANIYNKIGYHEELSNQNLNKNILPYIVGKNMLNLNQNWASQNNVSINENIKSYIDVVYIDDFLKDPIKYIDDAWMKRKTQINSNNVAYNILFEPHKNDW